MEFEFCPQGVSLPFLVVVPDLFQHLFQWLKRVVQDGAQLAKFVGVASQEQVDQSSAQLRRVQRDLFVTCLPISIVELFSDLFDSIVI